VPIAARHNTADAVQVARAGDVTVVARRTVRGFFQRPWRCIGTFPVKAIHRKSQKATRSSSLLIGCQKGHSQEKIDVPLAQSKRRRGAADRTPALKSWLM
jgi:hypothetical protein